MTLPVRPDYDYWRRRALAAERKLETHVAQGREEPKRSFAETFSAEELVLERLNSAPTATPPGGEPTQAVFGDPRKRAEIPIADTQAAKRSPCNYCGTWRSSPCGEGCYWDLRAAWDKPEPTQAGGGEDEALQRIRQWAEAARRDPPASGPFLEEDLFWAAQVLEAAIRHRQGQPAPAGVPETNENELELNGEHDG